MPSVCNDFFFSKKKFSFVIFSVSDFSLSVTLSLHFIWTFVIVFNGLLGLVALQRGIEKKFFSIGPWRLDYVNRMTHAPQPIAQNNCHTVFIQRTIEYVDESEIASVAVIKSLNFFEMIWVFE